VQVLRIIVSSDRTQGHTQTRQDSSGRVISPAQKPLTGNIQQSQETGRHPCPRRHSNQWFT